MDLKIEVTPLKTTTEKSMYDSFLPFHYTSSEKRATGIGIEKENAQILLIAERLLLTATVNMVEGVATADEEANGQHYMEGWQRDVNSLCHASINCSLRDCRSGVMDGRFVYILQLVHYL